MKKVIIMRGWPGTGKSTLAKCIKDAVVVSADNFFINGRTGEYKYYPDLIKNAHQSCKDHFFRCCSENINPIVVDNTNINVRQYRFYEDVAHEYGYKVYQLVAPKENHNNGLDMSAEACYKRNVHNVPLATIERMKKEFEVDDRLEHFVFT